MSVPAWITADAWVPLNPPAEVRRLGALPRTPEKLLAATRVLCVLTALRYQRTPNGTKCNIFTSDVCSILGAPLPHIADLADGLGRRELNANDTFDGLHAGKFPNWSLTGTIASASAVVELARQGKVQIAIWKNPTKLYEADGKTPLLDGYGRHRHAAGHIAPIVPSPEGKTVPYVTSAGGKCVQECPIGDSFGPATDHVEFWCYLR